MRRLNIGNGSGIEFLQGRFPEAESPGEPHRERVVHRLPAHPNLWDRDARIVIEEGFVAPGGIDIEGVKSGYGVFLTEDRDARLDEDGVGLSSTVRSGNRRIARDIATDVELVRIFVQGFAPELAAERKTDSTGRQIEQGGRVDGRIDRSEFRSVKVCRMDASELDRRSVGGNR